jgi:SAM-dependent methyltransferase
MSHLGGYIANGDANTYTPDIWGWLLLEYDIKSVMDIGCGTGVNMKWWKDMGCEVLGVEGHPDAISRRKCEPVIKHDYTAGPFQTGKVFDLCLCTEFVEHVEQEYECNWFKTMQCAKRVLMSHAVPGQGGYHHVNEQTADYWVKRFDDEGFEYNSSVSQVMQDTVSRKPASWGRNTLMLFENKKQCES